MTKHSARILRVAYNNAYRKILKLHMRCSASQVFADNNLLNFEALMRKMSNTFISRLISSDNAIIIIIFLFAHSETMIVSIEHSKTHSMYKYNNYIQQLYITI